MTGIRPLWNLWVRTYLRWASMEIPRDHPDAAYIAIRLAELEDK